MKNPQIYLVITAKSSEQLNKLVTEQLLPTYEILGRPGSTTTGYELVGGVSVSVGSPSSGSQIMFAQALYHRAAHQLELSGQ